MIFQLSSDNSPTLAHIHAVLRRGVVRGHKNPLYFSLPSRLRKALKQSGLTRAALARTAGVSHPIVGSLETGQSLTTVGTIARLASALGVTASWLAYGIGEQASDGTDLSYEGMAERLHTTRTDRDLTRTDLARLAELTPGTIAHIEGGGQAKVDTIEALAQALRVSPGWLAFGVGPQVLPSRRRSRQQPQPEPEP